MSTSLNTQGIQATFGWLYQQLITGLPNIPATSSFIFQPTQLSQGTGAGQVDRLYVSQQTIAASGSFSITLTNFADLFNNTLSMVRWKALFILLASGGASSIAIGNGTHPLTLFSSGTATEQVNSGGLKFTMHPTDAIGVAITASSTDTLKILNNDSVNAAVVSIGVAGCSA